ncbi:MAG: hypothetical protein KA143_14810 [Saprospiraceae bacterium]|nr:hypothetical protein [Saprospiraceae bacterium]
MEGILIEPKDQAESAFIHELLNKIGVKHADLNLDELEDLALGLMMQEVEDDMDLASEDEVLKKLRK